MVILIYRLIIIKNENKKVVCLREKKISDFFSRRERGGGVDFEKTYVQKYLDLVLSNRTRNEYIAGVLYTLSSKTVH